MSKAVGHSTATAGQTNGGAATVRMRRAGEFRNGSWKLQQTIRDYGKMGKTTSYVAPVCGGIELRGWGMAQQHVDALHITARRDSLEWPGW